MFGKLEFQQSEGQERKHFYGGLFYDYVLKQYGEGKAPKIVGMIIVLSESELQTLAQSYDNLMQKAEEANSLIEEDGKARQSS